MPNGSERKLDKKEYSQSCKSKNSTILGFVWTRYECEFFSDTQLGLVFYLKGNRQYS